MNDVLPLICYYSRPNRYSFHALLGALDMQEDLAALPVTVADSEKALEAGIDEALGIQPHVVAAISFATPQIREIESLVKRLRERFDESVFLLAGGPHATADPAGTLRMGFDAAVRGEGEETLPEVLRAIASGGEIAAVEGVATLGREGEMRFRPRRPLTELDIYPPFSVRHRRFGPIELTRGCSYGCWFCQTPRLHGAKPRHRSIEKVCDHVRTMRERGFSDMRFISPNALSYGSPDGRSMNLPVVETLLKRLSQATGEGGRLFFGSFPSEVRPEHLTPQAAALIRRYADNDNLLIGAQTGSDRLLAAIRRGHTVEDVRRAVAATLDAGFAANVDFIFGLPGETRTDQHATLELMRELAERGARIHAHYFMPLPGTPLSGEKPGAVSPDLEAEIARLISAGAAYGQWEAQRRIAKELGELLGGGESQHDS